jgi:hypothetical protein
MDASGLLTGYETLPYVFDDVAEARRFVDVYVSILFEDGKSGYDHHGDYWWACDASEELTIRRYTVEN